jgi:hypothetical protein
LIKKSVSLNRVMIIFLISTSYLTIYQLTHYCTELKSGETTK